MLVNLMGLENCRPSTLSTYGVWTSRFGLLQLEVKYCGYWRDGSTEFLTTLNVIAF